MVVVFFGCVMTLRAVFTDAMVEKKEFDGWGLCLV